MPDILLNGERRATPAGSSVADLLAALDLLTQHVAVERNRDIVPRAHYAETVLLEGDQLEVVTFVGGG